MTGNIFNLSWWMGLALHGSPFWLGISKSSSTSSPTQQTGGTLDSSSGQAVGNENVVVTGTVTDVDTTTEFTSSSNNAIGNNNVITYSGLSSADLAAIGNILSSSTSAGTGSGGVSISTTPPASTVKTQAWSNVVKWAVWGGVALGALLLWRVFFNRKTK